MNLSDLLRKVAASYLERTAEGPELPGWLRAEVVGWFAAHPSPSPAEQVEMAVGFARMAYREGYESGFGERLREEDGPSPDEVADAMDPGWRRVALPYRSGDPAMPPGAVPLEGSMTEDELDQVAVEGPGDEDDPG
jgi:hypothetical protein